MGLEHWVCRCSESLGCRPQGGPGAARDASRRSPKSSKGSEISPSGLLKPSGPSGRHFGIDSGAISGRFPDDQKRRDQHERGNGGDRSHSKKHI